RRSPCRVPGLHLGRDFRRFPARGTGGYPPGRAGTRENARGASPREEEIRAAPRVPEGRARLRRLRAPARRARLRAVLGAIRRGAGLVPDVEEGPGLEPAQGEVVRRRKAERLRQLPRSAPLWSAPQQGGARLGGRAGRPADADLPRPPPRG